jgi:hypothetical protein
LHNPFSILSASNITDIAIDTGIKLGRDKKSNDQFLLEILDKNRSRKVEFDKMCPTCQMDDITKVTVEMVLHIHLQIKLSNPRSGSCLIKWGSCLIKWVSGPM